MLTTILVDLLGQTGGRIGLTPSLEPVLIDIPEPVASEVRRHLADGRLTAWVMYPTGKWRLCPECWREALTVGQARKCYLKRGCKGTMVTADKVPTPPSLDGVPCARPSCTRPAWMRTHWGEAYCVTDWHALALLDLVEEDGDHADV